jgi:hypothetical protein
MIDYTEKQLNEFRDAGWEVGLRKIDENHCVAYAKKDGHTCVAEGDGELGALIMLKRSIQSLSDPSESILHSAIISEADGSSFTKAVIRYGISCYKEAGWGAVVIRDGCFNKSSDGRIEAKVIYLSTGTHQTAIPEKAYKFVHEYEPDKEVVLSLLTAGSDELAMVLRADSDWLLADEYI